MGKQKGVLMQVCFNCEKDYSKVGRCYKRSNEDRLDFYCTSCGSRRKPIDVEETEVEHRIRDITPYPVIKDPMERLDKVATDLRDVVRVTDGKRRVLVIPDTHYPFAKKGHIDFLEGIYNKYGCNEVVHLGDEIDFHFSSRHETDPDGMSAKHELEAAIESIKELAEAFPRMKVCYGNHSQIPKRQAYSAGLSTHLIKDMKDVYLDFGAKVEEWEFADHFIIDGVKYCHGVGRQAKARMLQDGCSIVQGHFHARSSIEYLANDYQLNFAMQLGALVEDDEYAFNYGKHFAKSHKNCGVVVEGLPIIEYWNYK